MGRATEIYHTMCKTKPVGICCMTQGTQTGALQQAKGWDEKEDGREVGKEGTCRHLWLILVMQDRKPQNPVKQLSFNLKRFFFKASKF